MRSIILILLLSLPTLLLANPPLGDPNEVWVDCSSRDTIYVGQRVQIEFYFANAAALDLLWLVFQIDSNDGATWEFEFQNDSLWDMQNGDNILYPNSESRFWGDALDFRRGGWGDFPPSGGPIDRFVIGAYSSSPPLAEPGQLEHAVSIYITPLSVGTICFDSSFIPPADDQWHWTGIDPSWNGPFCFTVIEPPAGDVNCDGAANVADAVYLINWIFKGGPPPCN